jgi:hypothetical protein
MKSLFLPVLCACLLLAVNGFAQGINGRHHQQDDSFFSKSIGLHAGTQGLGIQGQYPLLGRLGVRAGVSLMPYNGRGVYSIGSRSSNVYMSTSFLNTHALLDFRLFPAAKSVLNKFIFTGGAGYFYNATGRAKMTMNEGYRYGDIEFTGAELGEVRAKINWKGIAPYAGLGINNIRIDDKTDFSFQLGSYYMSRPDVNVSGTNMLAGNSANEEPLRRNLKNYRWLPVLQFNFNYDFNRQ